MNSYNKNYYLDMYGTNFKSKSSDKKNNEYLNEILKYKNQGNLFDFGCSFGYFLKIARPHFTVSGIDVSNFAIQKAKKYLGQNVSLISGNILNIKIEKKFDVITAYDVLEHLDGLDKYIVKLKNMLKRDGILIIVVPVYDGFFGNIVNLLDTDTTHIHKESRNWWVEKLTKHKFKILERSGIFRYRLNERIYLHFMKHKLFKISPAVMFILKK